MPRATQASQSCNVLFKSPQGAPHMGVQTRWLFHGTQHATRIMQDNNQAFRPNLAGLSTGALWGPGTYFARDAAYSHDYANILDSGARQMMLCLCRTGTPTVAPEGCLPTMYQHTVCSSEMDRRPIISPSGLSRPPLLPGIRQPCGQPVAPRDLRLGELFPHGAVLLHHLSLSTARLSRGRRIAWPV